MSLPSALGRGLGKDTHGPRGDVTEPGLARTRAPVRPRAIASTFFQGTVRRGTAVQSRPVGAGDRGALLAAATATTHPRSRRGLPRRGGDAVGDGGRRRTMIRGNEPRCGAAIRAARTREAGSRDRDILVTDCRVGGATIVRQIEWRRSSIGGCAGGPMSHPRCLPRSAKPWDNDKRVGRMTGLLARPPRPDYACGVGSCFTFLSLPFSTRFLSYLRAFPAHAPWPSRRLHIRIAHPATRRDARRCDGPAGLPIFGTDVTSASAHLGPGHVHDLPRGRRDDPRRVDPPGPLASYVTHGFLPPRWSGWADEQRRGSYSPLNRHPACL